MAPPDFASLLTAVENGEDDTHANDDDDDDAPCHWMDVPFAFIAAHAPGLGLTKDQFVQLIVAAAFRAYCSTEHPQEILRMLYDIHRSYAKCFPPGMWPQDWMDAAEIAAVRFIGEHDM